MAATATHPFACAGTESDHGRLDTRRVEVFPLAPLDVDLPYVRRLIVVRKTSACGAAPKVDTVSCYRAVVCRGRRQTGRRPSGPPGRV